MVEDEIMDVDLQQFIDPAQSPIGFVAFMAVLWIGIGYMLLILSGWRSLSSSYGCAEFSKGERRRFQSISMYYVKIYPVGFSNIITIQTDGENLGLALSIPFFLGFQPISIPLTDVTLRQSKMWFFKIIEVRCAKAPSVKIALTPAQVAWIKDRMVNDQGWSV